MIDTILNIIQSKTTIDEFLIKVSNITSKELFFVQDKLQMSRGKDVEHINVTVFKNFEEDGKKYKGSSTTKIAPTMNYEEISHKLDNAILSASFVKNAYYDLVDPTNEVAPKLESKFSEGNITDSIIHLVKDLFSDENNVPGAKINSCEFFININKSRILNSKGLDVEYESYSGQIELITEAKSDKEEVELFDVLDFADYDPKWIKEIVKHSLEKTVLRTQAVPLPQISDIPIILTGEAVKTFFDYYGAKSSGRLLYEGINQSNIGEMVQSEDSVGDKVTLSIKPFIPNSTFSRYYDNDGFYLKDVQLIQEGKLINMEVSKQYADYLNITPTGTFRNAVVEAGSKYYKEMKHGKYLELFNFSDFQMDVLTGNFGGEIRLGIYHDGKKDIPITLGSISGNAKTVETDMYFSRELQKMNGFIGPKIIKLNNVIIAGN
jgi:PmbA protein